MRMTIRKKLIGGFLVVLIISAIGSIVGLLGIQQINKKVTSITHEYWPTADATMEMWIGSLADIRGTNEYLSGGKEAIEQAKKGKRFFEEAFERLEQTGLVGAKEMDEIRTLENRYDAIQQKVFGAHNSQVAKMQELDSVIALFGKKLSEIEDTMDAQMHNMVASGAVETEVIQKYWEAADAVMEMQIGSLVDMREADKYLLGKERDMDVVKQGKEFYSEAFEVLKKTGLVDAKEIAEIRALENRYDAIKQEAYKAHEIQVVNMQKLDSTINLLHENLAKLEEKMDEKMDETAIASIATAKASYWCMIISSFICTTVGISVGFIISRNITKPLLELVDVTDIIAGGDLSQRAEITSNDEIGDLGTSFNYMTDEIQKRDEEIQVANEELRTTNEELESSNEELRSTTEELEASNEELRTTTEEIEELNRTLEQKVLKRTEDLMASNEELQSTTEELEASNEELRTSNEELETTQEKLVQKEKLAAIGQLASGVGHELRNPLGVIKNAAYYIKTKVGSDDPKLAKHLTIMEREINSSNRIISDLLGFSRTRLPSIAPSDVNQMVENAMEVVETPENILLVKEFDTALPKAMADADQMHQVFVNLSLNAVQAMGEGGQLKVKTRLAGDYVEVEFNDTGCGIPEENIKKLFDPFFSTKARGVGLGLAVTHGIVERNKGKIEVESKVSEGTTFVVKLPIEKQLSEKETTDKQKVTVS